MAQVVCIEVDLAISNGPASFGHVHESPHVS